MNSLFDPSDRKKILVRLGNVQAGATRQWGKMDAAQMCAHVATAMEMATGDAPREQKLIGKLLGPLFKKKLLGPEPFSKNSPTDLSFVVSNARDFAKEKARLLAVRGVGHPAPLSEDPKRIHNECRRRPWRRSP
jgi:hypothetical protein